MEISIASPETEVFDGHGGLRPREVSLVADDQTLYSELVMPLRSQMMRSIWRVVRHPDLAEDTLQNALAAIWKNRKRLSGHPNPRAFVLKICLNAAVDTLRKSRRLNLQEEVYPLSRLADEAGPTPTPDFEKREIEREVLKAIARLSKKQSAAVLMRLIQEEPYETIAQALQCSVATARIHVSRGRARLSRTLSHLLPASSRRQDNENE